MSVEKTYTRQQIMDAIIDLAKEIKYSKSKAYTIVGFTLAALDALDKSKSNEKR